MTSRDRVCSTIKHRTPDRVPLDLGAMRSTGIMSIAYNRLKKKLGFGLCFYSERSGEAKRLFIAVVVCRL
jgi:hypothetical protein